MSQIFGENVNKEIVKLLARTSGQVLSGFKISISTKSQKSYIYLGTVTSVFGGVTMLWDMYQLKTGDTSELSMTFSERMNNVNKQVLMSIIGL